MWDISVALFFNFAAMVTIGLGPSLYFLSDNRGALTISALSPAVGFVVTTLLGTYVTLLDCPLQRGATLILIAGTTLSIVLAMLALLRRNKERPPVNPRELWPPIGAFVLLSLLSVAPQLVGGLNYSVLRGNASDSFNYIALAGYLDHEPYSLASRTDVVSLVQRHPSYEKASHLLNSRWTTSMMLAFAARVGGAAPYKFEYFFSLLCYLLAFGPAYLFCRSLLNLALLPSLLAAIGVCGGFWAQLVLDLRADSQISSIPVLLLLVLLIARTEGDMNGRIWRPETAVIAAALASLFFLYTEICPTIVLALGFFGAAKLWHGEISVRILTRYLVCLCLALVAVIPAWMVLFRFVTGQIVFAATVKNNWDTAYFSWLYASPLAGVWGFSPLAGLSHVLKIVLAIVGAILTLAFAGAIVGVFYRKIGNRVATALAAMFAFATLVEAAYLCSRGQWWAAAKGVSFGYPFLIITLTAYAFGTRPARNHGLRAVWGTTVRVSAYIMLWVQCGLLAARPVLARSGLEYPNYIRGDANYKRHDLNTEPFAALLRSHKGAVVWSDISSPALAEYMAFVFGWDVRIINLGDSSGILDSGIPTPKLVPEFAFVENTVRTPFYGNSVVARNRELSLLEMDRPTLPIMGVRNAFGFEARPDTLFVRLGTEPATLTVLSPYSGRAALSGEFTIYASDPARRAIDLIVTSDAAPDPEELVVAGGLQQIDVPVKLGFTHFTFQVMSPIARNSAPNPRTLTLSVENLRFQGITCKAPCASVR